LVEAYNELAKADPAFFEKSERFAREAVKLSPRRQGLLYTLAFTLAGQDKFDEAIRTNREALALDPRLYKSHYHLGLILGLASDAKGNKGTPQGIAYREEAEREFKTMLDLAAENDFQFFSEVDFNNMEIIYSRWKDYASATKVIELGLERFPSKKQWYVDGISFYREMKDADGIIRLAERLQTVSPELKDSLDVIIDLARKRNWTILNSL
jgi:tetratricopeptide (TPR) repeat protein